MSEFPLSVVAQSLTSLPPEIAHQVLDDLRVWDILRLTCHNIPYINECILSHPVCGALFNHEKDILSKLCDATLLYWEMCRSLNTAAAPDDSPLARSIHLFKPDPVKIEALIHHATVNLLRKRHGVPHSFERYAPKPPGLPSVWDDSSIKTLRSRWETVKTTQATLSTIKHSQLLRLASLLEDNPDILKRTQDPEQVRRPNTSHIVGRLRVIAEKVKNHSVYRTRAKTFEEFGYPFLPVIPFDSVLEFVVQELPKHVQIGANGSLLNEETANHSPGGLAAIAIVVRGIKYIYLPEVIGWTGAPIYRTAFTAYSAPAGGIGKDQKPAFQNWRNVVDESFEACSQFEQSNLGYEPHDEREIEWLEAFVIAYRYLKKLKSS